MSDLSLNGLFDLSGRVALVTGGGTGIGLMIACGLATNGAKVYISGRRKEVLESASGAIGTAKGSIHPLQMDVTDKASIMGGVEEIEARDGKLHILVNKRITDSSGQVGPVSTFFNKMSSPEHKDPGTLGLALFNNESFESWGDLYRINTFSIFFVTTAFLGLLSKGSQDQSGFSSVVINVTSISGLMKQAQDHFAYNSSKAAASHLTKLLSTEFALKNVPVRVNAIAPGVYASEMTIPDIQSPELTNAIAKGVQPVPAGRGGTDQEMAGTVVYLASRSGAYANGQEIAIDGGALAVNPSTI